MVTETELTAEAYAPRGLMFCWPCGLMGHYRTLKEGDSFRYRHRWHRLMVLRQRRPGWRRFGRPVAPGST